MRRRRRGLKKQHFVLDRWVMKTADVKAIVDRGWQRLVSKRDREWLKSSTRMLGFLTVAVVAESNKLNGDSKTKVGMLSHFGTASSDVSGLLVANVVRIEDNVVQSF